MGAMLDATQDFVLLDSLKALAKRLAQDIDACRVGNADDAKTLPGLSRQYRETMLKIDAIEGGNNDDDEIATIILRNRQSGSD
jgi:hypothetical protein